jgi:hypothetical protein
MKTFFIAEVGPLYRGGSIVTIQRSYFDELDSAIERAFGVECGSEGKEIGALGPEEAELAFTGARWP